MVLVLGAGVVAVVFSRCSSQAVLTILAILTAARGGEKAGGATSLPSPSVGPAGATSLPSPSVGSRSGATSLPSPTTPPLPLTRSNINLATTRRGSLMFAARLLCQFNSQCLCPQPPHHRTPRLKIRVPSAGLTYRVPSFCATCGEIGCVTKPTRTVALSSVHKHS